MVSWVKGKTHLREIVFQPCANKYVRRLYDLHVQEIGETPATEGYVICHHDGHAILSFNNSFKSLMYYAGIPLA